MADSVANLLLRVLSDSGAAESDLDALGRSLRSLDSQTASPDVTADTKAAESDLDRLARQLTALDRREVDVPVHVDRDGSARVGLQAVAAGLKGLLSQATQITAVGFAAQAIGGLAAVVVGLGAAIAPAAGGLAAMPALMAAAGQGAAVLKLGLLGVSDSVTKALEPALKETTPALNDFAKFVKGFAPDLVHLRNIAQGPILRGLTDGIRSATGNFGRLNPIVRQSANAIAGLMRGFGEFVGSPGFGRDLATVGRRNVSLIKILGGAAGDLGRTVVDLIVEVGPLTMWLARMAAGWAANAREATAAARQSGALAGFFERTREVLSRLFSILGSVGSLLASVGRAGYDFGRDMLAGIDQALAGFATLAKSAEGQTAIRRFFDDLRPAAAELGKLIVALGGAFASLATQPGLAALLRTLREDLLPVLVRVVGSTTQAFGPALLETITQLVRAFEPLAGSSGPLVLFVKALGAVAKVVADITQSVPGASTALTTLVGSLAVFKASLLLGKFTGFTALLRFLGVTKTATDAATLASTRHRAAEIAGTAASRLKAAALAIASGATTAYAAITNASVLANVRARAAAFASVAAITAQYVATGLATAATTALGVAMTVVTSPIFLVVAAIAAVIAIGYLLIRNWDAVRSALGAVWGFLGSAAQVAFGLVKQAAEIGLLGPVALIIARWGEVRSFLGSAWSAMAGAASAAWNAIRGSVTSSVNAASGVVQSVIGALTGFIGGVWNAIRGGVASAWNAIEGLVASGARGAAGAAKTAIGAVTGFVADVWGDVRGGVDKGWDAIKGAISSAVKGAVGAVTGQLGAFRSAGAGIIDAIKDGVVGAAESVYNAVRDVIRKAKNLLPGSEPKDPSSPLRGLRQSGAAIMENLAGGIPVGARKLVQQLHANLSVVPTMASLSPRLTVPAGPRGDTYNTTRNYYLPPGPGGGVEPTFAAAQIDNLLRDEGALR